VCIALLVEDHEDADDWGEVSGPLWMQNPDKFANVGMFGNPLDSTSIYQGSIRNQCSVSIGVSTLGWGNVGVSYQSECVGTAPPDKCFFDYSCDGGATWVTVDVGGNHPWTQWAHDLSNLSGGRCDNNPDFAIRFSINSSTSNNQFRLDNILVTACAASPPAPRMVAWGLPEARPVAPASQTVSGTPAAAPLPPRTADTRDRAAGLLASRGAAAVQTEYEVYLRNDSWEQVPQPGDWAGLILSSPEQSYLENAVVEFARRGLDLIGAAQGSFELRNSSLRSNWVGLLALDSAAAVTGAFISGQTWSPDAELIPGGADPAGVGLVCAGSSDPVVSFSVFMNNGIAAVLILDDSVPSLGEMETPASPGHNQFRSPRGDYHVVNRTPNTIYAQMNAFELLSGEGVEDTLFDNTDDAAMGPIIWLPLGGATAVDARNWESYR